MAWTNPSQNPPLGGGLLQTDSSGLKIVTTTQITSGDLIVNNGNVGIGTIIPGAKLEVTGRVYQSGLGFSTFFGYGAGANDDLTNNYNTAVGYQALYFNTSSVSNTAVGYRTLYSNTSGSFNTAVGNTSLYSNTSGTYNTAVGYQVLYSNTSGSSNTAVGNSSLYSNTSGSYNTTVGNSSLYSNTSGSYNTTVGNSSLYSNTSGSYNTTVGNSSLYSNTSGSSNTAVGYNSGYRLLTGLGNTFLGYGAGNDLTYSPTTGSYNILIGYNAWTPATTTSNFLNIGGLIFGTNLSIIAGSVSTGNVGIGTANPVTKLSISTDGTTKSLIDSFERFQLHFGDTTGYLTVSNDLQTAYFGLAGNEVFSGAFTATKYHLRTNNQNRVTINSTGNVGIGITDPNVKLHVVGGDVAISTQGNGLILRATDGANCFRLTVNNSGTITTTSIVCP